MVINKRHRVGTDNPLFKGGRSRWYGVALASTLRYPYLCKECAPYREDKKLSALSMEDAREIRLKRSSGERGVDLAMEYGVSTSTICDIVKGRKYRESN